MKKLLLVAAILPFLLGMHLDKQDINSMICTCSDRDTAQLREQLTTLHPEARITSINPTLGYYRVTYPSFRRDSKPAEERIKSTMIGTSIRCYPDRKVSLRITPNDPMWGEQWDMQRIALEQAWEYSTGGLTYDGDTIVIAILDAGYNTEHPDIQGELWLNNAEIPGDSIDNDGNGYVDDHLGLNLQTGDDEHPVHFHGAAVSGIIGSRGNNAIGLSGVNWNIRLLLISGIERESDIIEGYNYTAELRRRYDESGGTDGAFIVATNLSAGIDGAFAADHPMWCAAYDDLGSEGILSVASTTNSNVFVDEDGDMPSTCASDFLIMVTNTTIDDVKMNPAGYGQVNIDLGAPGTTSRAIGLGNEYQNFPGTSAAAPHVTGVVGLLYSLPCAEFMAQARQSPAETALFVKSSILNGVDVNDDLREYTLSGGRLNALNAADEVLKLCVAIGSPLEIVSAQPNPTLGPVDFIYSSPDLRPLNWYVFDASGRIVFSESVIPSGLEPLVYNIDFSNFTPGVYFVLVEGNDGKSSTRVVVP